jgi:hypothetical protein
MAAFGAVRVTAAPKVRVPRLPPEASTGTGMCIGGDEHEYGCNRGYRDQKAVSDHRLPNKWRQENMHARANL